MKTPTIINIIYKRLIYLIKKSKKKYLLKLIGKYISKDNRSYIVCDPTCDPNFGHGSFTIDYIDDQLTLTMDKSYGASYISHTITLNMRNPNFDLDIILNKIILFLYNNVKYSKLIKRCRNDVYKTAKEME